MFEFVDWKSDNMHKSVQYSPIHLFLFGFTYNNLLHNNDYKYIPIIYVIYCAPYKNTNIRCNIGYTKKENERKTRLIPSCFIHFLGKSVKMCHVKKH